jgi:pimeloyl-ACP methyl ester carboxylesterase
MRHPFHALAMAGAAVLAAASLMAPARATEAPDHYRFCPGVGAYELSRCDHQFRLPATPAGRQLRWVLDLLAAGGPDLSVEEVQAHLDPALLALFPAEQVVATFRATYAELGAGRFRGFDHPARAHQAVALVDTPRLRAAAAVGVDSASGLIDELAVTEAPPMIVPHGAHSGWYDVGGRRLFLRCTGTGSPTVVFENGLTTDWFDLQNRLSRTTRTCSYDPALQNGSFSRSDPAPTPRSGSDRVSDLHRLLSVARVRGPIVLAGHSNGGLLSLLYAARHPGQVAGLVLIDGVHPAYHRREVAMLRHHLPPEAWAEFAAHTCDIPPAVVDPERLDICGAERQTRAALRAHPLSPMPLAVITHGLVAPGTYPDGWPAAASERLWSRLQDQLAALERGSRHVIAIRSDHDVQHEQPGLVLRQVTAVVTAVRHGRTWLDSPTGQGG